jgi:hypothetical protein
MRGDGSQRTTANLTRLSRSSERRGSLDSALEVFADLLAERVAERLSVGRASDRLANDPLLPLAEAARRAATSTRVLREAIRRGDLAGFGRQRDRAVRLSDLERWVESRRLAPTAGVDDPDMDRRVARLLKRRHAATDSKSRKDPANH